MKVYKKRVYKKKLVKKNKVAKPSKTLVKQIHNVINKESEGKYITTTGQNQAIYSYNTVTTSYPTFLITPVFTQNSTESGRIGNTIQTTKVILRYRLYTLPSSVNTPIRLCRVLIARKRNQLTSDPSTSMPGLFRSSTGSVNPINNDLDQFYQINSAEWVVAYDKQHKVGCSSPVTNYSLTNNDFQQSVTVAVNLQRHFGKMIFPDATTTSTNKNWYMWVIPSNADGSTFASGVDSAIKLTYEAQFYYKDI